MIGIFRSWKKGLFMLWLVSLGLYAYNSHRIAKAANHVKELSVNPKGVILLDLCYMGFNSQTVESSFSAMGEMALGRYRILEIWEDSDYPLAYMFLLVMTMVLLIRHLKVHWLLGVLFILLPILAMFFDLYENAHIVMLIDDFPEIIDEKVQKASMYNTYKWIFVTCSLATVLVMSSIALVRKFYYNTVKT